MRAVVAAMAVAAMAVVAAAMAAVAAAMEAAMAAAEIGSPAGGAVGLSREAAFTELLRGTAGGATTPIQPSAGGGRGSCG